LHLQKQVGLKLDYFGIRAIGPAWSLVLSSRYTCAVNGPYSR